MLRKSVTTYQIVHFLFGMSSAKYYFALDTYSNNGKTSLVAIKHTEFQMPGFAVYLNYMGICPDNSIILKKDNVSNLNDAVTFCQHQKTCSSITLSYSNGIASQPGYQNYLWYKIINFQNCHTYNCKHY